jgi:hypothetical protein
MDEIVGMLTQDQFRGKLITVLAGYTHEINDLLRINPGLSSRFPDEVIFANLTADQCAEILKKASVKSGVRVQALDDSTSLEYQDIIEALEDLATLNSWGNARDVITLSKQMVSKAFVSAATTSSNSANQLITLPYKDALDCMQAMFRERRARHSGPVKSKPFRQAPLPTQSSAPPAAPPPPAAGASSSAPPPNTGASSPPSAKSSAKSTPASSPAPSRPATPSSSSPSVARSPPRVSTPSHPSRGTPRPPRG